ncbi:MAG: MBL fold metallo-hydrolase, partial [Bacteroidota bacterium]
LRYLNKKREKKGMELIEPLYDIDDVLASLAQFEAVPYNKPFMIDDDIELTYIDIGHILGAASINLKIKDGNHTKRITYTGDIGRPNDKILKAPTPFPQADILITESTYGNRLHEQSEAAEKRLCEIVHSTCVERKGKLIIPAFSLGRTQEIVYALNRLKNKGKLPHIKVFVDSPLSTNATNIMRKHPECFNADIIKYMIKDPDPFGFNDLFYIQDVKDSIALNDSKEPCIIISASGMMEAGRIKHHLKNNLPDAANTVLIVGYCPPNTLGRRLIEGEKLVTIYGKEYPVNASIEKINSYSSHGDYKEMIEFLSCQEKSLLKKIFLVHGEYDVQKDYKKYLTEAGFFHIEIPDEGEVFKV